MAQKEEKTEEVLKDILNGFTKINEKNMELEKRLNEAEKNIEKISDENKELKKELDKQREKIKKIEEDEEKEKRKNEERLRKEREENEKREREKKEKEEKERKEKEEREKREREENLKREKLKRRREIEVDIITNRTKDVKDLPPFDKDFKANIINLHDDLKKKKESSAWAAVLVIFCPTSRVVDEIGKENIEIINKLYKDKRIYLVVEKPVATVEKLANAPMQEIIQEVNFHDVKKIVYNAKFLDHTESQLRSITDQIRLVAVSYYDSQGL